MNASVFVDTNVLVYLFDADAPVKQQRSRSLVESGDRLVISTQVLQEFYVTLTRKLARPLPEDEAEAATRELASLDVVDVDVDLVFGAISLARRDHLSLWDALIVEAAHARRCERLLTEDLQHGRRFGPLRVENPFL